MVLALSFVDEWLDPQLAPVLVAVIVLAVIGVSPRTVPSPITERTTSIPSTTVIKT